MSKITIRWSHDVDAYGLDELAKRARVPTYSIISVSPVLPFYWRSPFPDDGVAQSAAAPASAQGSSAGMRFNMFSE